jgi:hypothetical protein
MALKVQKNQAQPESARHESDTPPTAAEKQIKDQVRSEDL